MKKLKPNRIENKQTVASSATVRLNRAMIAAALLLVVSLTALSLYLWQPTWLFPIEEQAPVTPPATTTPPLIEETCLDCEIHPLSGLLMKESETRGRPWAVMIDNYVSARPSAGLSSATLVYEAPVEGGVTRLMAVFNSQDLPAEIGPVRSARPYFLKWAQELGATYVHVGGSPEALALAKNLGVNDVNEFYQGSYFWRANNRPAPHNVLTSKEKLDSYRQDLIINEEDFSLLDQNYFSPYQFEDLLATEINSSSLVKVKYSEGYNVSWRYLSDTSTYQRYLENGPHQEADGSLIMVDNLIFPLRAFKVIDDDLRVELIAQSGGTALLCQNGTCDWGSWKQNNSSERWRFYEKDGSEFVFKPGKTWISVINHLEDVQY